MTNAVAKLEPKRSILIETATRYHMEATAFEQTLRATVVPKDCTKEQFAAFLLVANEYNLNPITKEIYAFPTRGGGIQPIVGIDGWCNLINSNPQLDGIEFDDHLSDQDAKLTAVTCKIWRKDRAKPIMVTEYMVECLRNTDPWRQYPRRMLRHKALIQCARYAFGYAGIVDPDEAERIIQAEPAQQIKAPAPPEETAIEGEVLPPTEAATDVNSRRKPKERTTRRGEQKDGLEEVLEAAAVPQDPEALLKWIDDRLAKIEDAFELPDVWEAEIMPKLADAFPPDREQAEAAYDRHERRLEPK